MMLDAERMRLGPHIMRLLGALCAGSGRLRMARRFRDAAGGRLEDMIVALEIAGHEPGLPEPLPRAFSTSWRLLANPRDEEGWDELWQLVPQESGAGPGPAGRSRPGARPPPGGA